MGNVSSTDCKAASVEALPNEIPFTHRGTALAFDDGRITVETESVAELRFPRTRFIAPVSHAVFIFGVAVEQAVNNEDMLAPVYAQAQDGHG